MSAGVLGAKYRAEDQKAENLLSFKKKKKKGIELQHQLLQINQMKR